MIVCPECGFTEKYDWKNSPHQLFMRYLSPEEAAAFLTEHPKLKAELEIDRMYAEEGHYAFRITKAGYLHRQPKVHCVGSKWANYSSCYENAKRARERKLQKKLLPLIVVQKESKEKQ